ncbi:MAG: hypothetical protein VXY93_22825, partial [Pseudomonadota bacterium]|nr:hypothetical protein [Pseudomonadota bacterium]
KGVIKPNENYDTHNINSTGIVTAVGANFTGDVNVGGVLTYEDVTSIDSVGIITARNGIDCNGDIDVDGHTNLDNVSIAGVSTFSGNINFPDNVYARFGNSQDLYITHHPTNGSIINHFGNNHLVIRSGNRLDLRSANDDSYWARFVENGAAELYHDGDLKFETSTTG